MQMILERNLGSRIFSLRFLMLQEQEGRPTPGEVACGLSPVCPQAPLWEPRAQALVLHGHHATLQPPGDTGSQKEAAETAQAT